MDIENCIQSQPVENSIIKVIGVGGAGGNAVRNMIDMDIKGVTYVICNTDLQALNNNPVPLKIQLGRQLTEGLGAGNDPDVGRRSAIEATDEIKDMLKGTKMVFITAGMGGGTGTGAAPVIAQIAKEEMGILTVGIVAIPYKNEGQPRIVQAIKGIEEMIKHVDSLLVINSERLREMYGKQTMRQALRNADKILAIAAKGIAEMISIHGTINVDFADVRTAMKDSGMAVMGMATAKGENRAIDAVKAALDSPILNNNDIRGAKHVLVNIFSSGEEQFELTQDEQGIITSYLSELIGMAEHETLIWGCGIDDNLREELRVTVVATGFANDCFTDNHQQKTKEPEKYEVNTNGYITKVSETENVPDDEMISQPIDITYSDSEKIKIEKLYNQPVAQKNNTTHYSTKNLADPTPVPLQDLLNEEIIQRIEDEPAYMRRSGHKE